MSADLAQTRGLPPLLFRKQKISFDEKWIYTAWKYSSFVRTVEENFTDVYYMYSVSIFLSSVCTVLIQQASSPHKSADLSN